MLRASVADRDPDPHGSEVSHFDTDLCGSGSAATRKKSKHEEESLIVQVTNIRNSVTVLYTT
jgi:hypothetical protein